MVIFKHAKKATLVIFSTTFRWTALVKQTNTANRASFLITLRTSLRTIKGPAKFMPVLPNGREFRILSSERSAMIKYRSCPNASYKFSHHSSSSNHLSKGQKGRLIWASNAYRPQWSISRWQLSNISWVNLWPDGSTIGFFGQSLIFAFINRPPTNNDLLLMKGYKPFNLLLRDTSLPFSRTVISFLKDSTYTRFNRVSSALNWITVRYLSAWILRFPFK